jgi:hypothetical protein
MAQLTLFNPVDAVITDGARGRTVYSPRFVDAATAARWFEVLRRGVPCTAPPTNEPLVPRRIRGDWKIRRNVLLRAGTTANTPTTTDATKIRSICGLLRPARTIGMTGVRFAKIVPKTAWHREAGAQPARREIPRNESATSS